MARDSFVFFLEWADILMDYPAEVRHEVYDAIIRYAQSGTLSELKPQAAMAFAFIKRDMDRSTAHYSAISEARREAGRKGGAPTGNSNAGKEAKTSKNKQNKQNKQKQAKTSKTSYNDNDNDNDVANATIKENLLTQVKESAATDKPSPPVSQSKNSFVAPTEEEVVDYMQQYAQQRQLPFNRRDAEQCYAYYESNGWIVGRGNKMKDWRAAARGWLLRSSTAPPRAAPYNSSKVDNVHFTGEGNRSIYDHEEEKWQQPLSSDNRRYDNEQNNWQTKQTG